MYHSSHSNYLKFTFKMHARNIPITLNKITRRVTMPCWSMCAHIIAYVNPNKIYRILPCLVLCLYCVYNNEHILKKPMFEARYVGHSMILRSRLRSNKENERKYKKRLFEHDSVVVVLQ